MYSFNIHGKRVRIIKKEKLDVYYSRCSKEEYQKYIIQHNKAYKEVFLTDVKEKLSKIGKNNEDHKKIDSVIQDIQTCLNRNDNYEINQELISFKELFRGYTVKNQFRVDIEDQSNHKYDKILVKECMNFYYKYWMERCVILCHSNA